MIVVARMGNQSFLDEVDVIKDDHFSPEVDSHDWPLLLGPLFHCQAEKILLDHCTMTNQGP